MKTQTRTKERQMIDSLDLILDSMAQLYNMPGFSGTYIDQHAFRAMHNLLYDVKKTIHAQNVIR